MKFGLDLQPNFLKKNKMKEKEIKLEKVETKKRTYKPKKRKIVEVKVSENPEIDDMVMKSSEVILNTLRPKKNVGSYKVGKSFYVYFTEKPNIIHRFFTKIFLGWTWIENK